MWFDIVEHLSGRAIVFEKDGEELGEAEREMDARKLLPARFEVYEVEVRTGDLGGMPGIIGWMGKAQND